MVPHLRSQTPRGLSAIQIQAHVESLMERHRKGQACGKSHTALLWGPRQRNGMLWGQVCVRMCWAQAGGTGIAGCWTEGVRATPEDTGCDHQATQQIAP